MGLIFSNYNAISKKWKEKAHSLAVGVEVGGEQFLVKDYEETDKPRLLDAFDNLLMHPEGVATLRSRFYRLVPRDLFEAYLDNPEIDYRVVLGTPMGKIVGWVSILWIENCLAEQNCLK